MFCMSSVFSLSSFVRLTPVNGWFSSSFESFSIYFSPPSLSISLFLSSCIFSFSSFSFSFAVQFFTFLDNLFIYRYRHICTCPVHDLLWGRPAFMVHIPVPFMICCGVGQPMVSTLSRLSRMPAGLRLPSLGSSTVMITTCRS